MTAKRTQREIRRVVEFSQMITEQAKKIGTGQGRQRIFSAMLDSMKHFQMLPSHRQAYLRGFADGAGAVLALDLNAVSAPPTPVPRAKRIPSLPPAPPIETTPPAPPIETTPPAPAPRSDIAPKGTADSGVYPAISGPDIEALAWLANALRGAAKTG